MEQVDAIAKAPGVDVLFVGQFDLGNNIGHVIKDGIMDPELETAIAVIQEATEANGKAVGIYCTSGEQAKSFADNGFHMVSSSCSFPSSKPISESNRVLLRFLFTNTASISVL